MEPHKVAIELINRVTALAQTLAAAEMEVLSLECNFGAFGNWCLQVCRARPLSFSSKERAASEVGSPGPNLLRTTWDGRDGVLILEISPTMFAYGPNNWSPVGEKTFGVGPQNREAALLLAERCVLAWNRAGRVEDITLEP